MKQNLVAMADSSWFSNPTGGRKYHFISEGCGSACGLQMLCIDLAESVEGIPEILRCKRRGCKEKWIENEAKTIRTK